MLIFSESLAVNNFFTMSKGPLKDKVRCLTINRQLSTNRTYLLIIIEKSKIPFWCFLQHSLTLALLHQKTLFFSLMSTFASCAKPEIKNKGITFPIRIVLGSQIANYNMKYFEYKIMCVEMKKWNKYDVATCRISWLAPTMICSITGAGMSRPSLLATFIANSCKQGKAYIYQWQYENRFMIIHYIYIYIWREKCRRCRR